MEIGNNISFGMGFKRPTGENLKLFNRILSSGSFSSTTHSYGLYKLEKRLSKSNYDVQFNHDSFEILDKKGNVLETIQVKKVKYPGLFDRGLCKHQKILDENLQSSEIKKSWLATKAVCSMIYNSIVVKVFKPEESLPDALRFTVKRVKELEKQNLLK